VEKESIGKACAELIQPNQSVIVDAGTTCYHVARYLEQKLPYVVTNSLPVANLFASANRLEVVVSGGVIYPRLGVLVGPLAVESFSKLRADVAIMGAGGITVEGITNSHGLLIDIQRAMMRAAQRVIFCLDHTKLGRHSVSFLCPLEQIDVVVTDQPPPSNLAAALQSNGVNLFVAG
jgi:DeoR/GlpR family transcriptional regulator of sugar metabolism